MNKEKNMEIWNQVAQPPKEALSQIGGGRLRGMTDINPQWRYEALTEVFGVCGFGWRYRIIRVWREDAIDSQVFAFAEVEVQVKLNDEWSEPIPGIGGSMLVTKETKGLYACDEGYKMAITDALSTALKMIGVGADIYAGRWDGSKYSDKNNDNSETAHRVTDWITLCKDAAETMAYDTFSKWWPENKAKIISSVGDAGAAKVYVEYRALWGKATSQEKK